VASFLIRILVRAAYSALILWLLVMALACFVHSDSSRRPGVFNSRFRTLLGAIGDYHVAYEEFPADLASLMEAGGYFSSEFDDPYSEEGKPFGFSRIRTATSEYCEIFVSRLTVAAVRLESSTEGSEVRRQFSDEFQDLAARMSAEARGEALAPDAPLIDRILFVGEKVKRIILPSGRLGS